MFKWLNNGVCALNNYLRRFEDYLSEVFDDFGDDYYYYEPEDIYDDEEDDEDEDFYF